MNHPIPVTVIALLCSLLQGLQAFDEKQPVRFGMAKAWSPSFSSDLYGALAPIERDLAQGVFDPQAENLLASAQNYTEHVFNVPSLRLAKAITRRDNGDILAVEWKIEEPFGRGSLFLQDDPFISTYNFRLTGCSIQTRADLTAFLSRLIVWNKPPINLMPGALDVRLTKDEPIGQFVGFAIFGSTAFFSEFMIQATAGENEWLINVRLGKTFTASFYPVPPYVPERFPPLTKLIESWTFERLWSEVGGNYGSAGSLSEYRDRVLIGELVRRGVSGEQVIELLRNTDVKNLGMRARIVFDALQRQHKPGSVKSVFSAALEIYERLGPAADDAVERLLWAAGSECAPEFEAPTLSLLKSGVFQGSALVYLGRCSTSQEALQVLDNVAVPNELARRRESAQSEIRRRLSVRR